MATKKVGAKYRMTSAIQEAWDRTGARPGCRQVCVSPCPLRLTLRFHFVTCVVVATSTNNLSDVRTTKRRRAMVVEDGDVSKETDLTARRVSVQYQKG